MFSKYIVSLRLYCAVLKMFIFFFYFNILKVIFQLFFSEILYQRTFRYAFINLLSTQVECGDFTRFNRYQI